MVKLCKSCCKFFFKPKSRKVVQSQIESSQFENPYSQKSNQTTKKDQEPFKSIQIQRHPSPLKSTTAPIRIDGSKDPNSKYFDLSQNASSISFQSICEDLPPVNIPSPKIKPIKRTPSVFHLREGKLPKLILASPKNKYPKSKSSERNLAK